jgi:hypothetical protein
MYTSVMLLALSGLVGAAADAPVWQNDYSAAQKQGETQSKPLAVFLAPGENGWDKLSREGGLEKEAKQLLAGKYVPVYVNTDTDAGKRLARAFEMSSDKGIVLSDRTGAVQAFWHEGDLANQDLVRYLQRYSDSQLVIRTTETNPSERVSYYAPEGQGSAKGHAPAGHCPPGGCCASGPGCGGGYSAPVSCAGGSCGGSSCGGGRFAAHGGGGRRSGRCGGCR